VIFQPQKVRQRAHVERGQAFDAPLLEQTAPAADRVVVAQQKLGDLLTALANIQKRHGVGAPRHAADHRAVARQRDQALSIFFAQKAATNHVAMRIPSAARCKRFFPDSQRVGDIKNARSWRQQLRFEPLLSIARDLEQPFLRRQQRRRRRS
jgi:hypothetical protein